TTEEAPSPVEEAPNTTEEGTSPTEEAPLQENEVTTDPWDEEAKERFETAVFTLATFAAVFAVYMYIVYSLSSPPTVLDQV
ncbi:uncharacterized protein LOC116415410, partial [Apis florea]|uniref:uncharacterized protein LOC116415410 n=1 Tax=Apis florea TaxID=7463 RepID=UPI000252C7FF